MIPLPPKIPFPVQPLPIPGWHPLAQLARWSQMLVKMLLFFFVLALFTCFILWWVWEIFDRLMERRDQYYWYKKNGGKDE